MKIIFLDFDGVLNRFDEPESLRALSKTCMVHFNALVEKTDASIVVSSVWRLMRTVADLREIMVNAGFKFPAKVIGKTPRLKYDPLTHPERGEEIDVWMKKFPLDIDSFVILDDDSDMYPHMDKLVQTNSNIGLTPEDVENCIKILLKN